MPLIWTALATAAADTDPYGSQKLHAILWLAVLIVAVYSPFLAAKLAAPKRIARLTSKLNATIDPDARKPLERKIASWQEIGKRSYFSYILGFAVGVDGRVSTSKMIAAVWTLVVAYILIALVLVWPSEWQKALEHLDGAYLAVLGGPYASLVLAKVLVSSRVASQALQKPENDGIPRLSDLVTNDGGTTDLFDLQYLIFNVIAMAFVLNGFAHATLGGFPEVPTTLWLLTAGPAAVYVSNKAFAGNAPLIFSVSPARVKPLGKFTVYGQNFVPAGADKTQVQVLINGSKAAIEADSVTDTSVRATVPAVVDTPDTPLPIALITPTGVPAYRDAALTIVKGPVLLPLAPAVKVAPGGQFTLQGTWTLGVNGAAPTVLVDGVAAITSGPATRHAVNVTVPTGLRGGDRQVEVIVSDDLGSSDPVKLTIS